MLPLKKLACKGLINSTDNQLYNIIYKVEELRVLLILQWRHNSLKAYQVTGNLIVPHFDHVYIKPPHCKPFVFEIQR